jgi:hypothetical protein
VRTHARTPKSGTLSREILENHQFDGSRGIRFLIGNDERRGASNPVAVFPVWHAQ